MIVEIKITRIVIKLDYLLINLYFKKSKTTINLLFTHTLFGLFKQIKMHVYQSTEANNKQIILTTKTIYHIKKTVKKIN